MANGGLKPATGKIIGTAMGLLIVILGVFGDKRLDLAKAIILISASLILLAEYTWKNLIDKENRAIDVITAAFIITLMGVGLLSLTSLQMPAFIGAASTYILVLAGIWVAVETWT